MNITKKHNISKDQLLQAIALKRKCNETAQNIVIELLEPNILEDYFLSKLRHILPCHYDDIIDERFIVNLCGYPLCSTKLENIASQKYIVSPKTNKVYDITERKKFCSGECYKASNYIQEQIPTSPLWVRRDNNIPTFKTLSLTKIN